MFGFEVRVVNSLVFLKGREVKGNKKKRGEEMRKVYLVSILSVHFYGL